MHENRFFRPTPVHTPEFGHPAGGGLTNCKMALSIIVRQRLPRQLRGVPQRASSALTRDSIHAFQRCLYIGLHEPKG